MNFVKATVLAALIALPGLAGEAKAAWDCTAYGQFAMRDVRRAIAAQCGFTGPRWSTDEGLHYGFCVERLQNNDDNAMTVETDMRMEQVAACEEKFAAANFCTAYAKAAIAAVNEAAQLSCGFDGARWSQDEGLHYGYCVERTNAGDKLSLENEANARRADVAQCKIAAGDKNTGDGGDVVKKGGVKIIAEVTGYDSVDAKKDKCYLHPGDTAVLLGVDENDPNWKHLQGPGACDGRDFWLYDDGKLEAL